MPQPLSYQRIRNSLTPEGFVFVVILIFIAVCAVLRNVNLLVVVSGVMFASLLLSWRINRHAVRHLSVLRSTPHRIHAGQPVNIQWQATNLSRFKSFGLVVTDLILPLGRDRRRRSFRRRASRGDSRGVVVYDRIESGQTRYSSYRVLFSQRGLYEAGPAVVSSRFPLPLIQCWFRTRQMEELVVAPPIGELAADWKQRVTGNAGRSDWHSSLRRPDEDEFFAIRKWRSGDNMRKIHWRSTAKHRQPMVKQFDRPVSQDIAIVLDLFADPGRMDAASNYEQSADICETILSFAATVLAIPENTASGRLVIGIAGRQASICSSLNQTDFTVNTLRELATAESSPTPDIGTVIASVAELVPVHTPCCVFSSRTIAGYRDIDPVLKTGVRWMYCGERWFENLYSGPGGHHDGQVESRLVKAMGSF